MSNISKTVTDTTMGSMEPNMKPTLGHQLALRPFTFDDLEQS